MAGCYRADLGDVDEPFLDAFTIVTRHPTGAGEGAVPYLNVVSTVIRGLRFHQIWFHHRRPIPDPNQCTFGSLGTCQVGTISCCNEPQNFFHLLGVTVETEDQRQPEPASITWGAMEEKTDVMLVYRERIETDVDRFCRETGCDRGSTIPLMVQNVTAHEVAHHFGVNPERVGDVCDGGGHDSNRAWCGGPGDACVDPLQPDVCKEDRQAVQWCLMHRNLQGQIQQTVCQRTRGWVRMDCRDLLGDVSCPEQPDCTGPERASVRRARDPR